MFEKIKALVGDNTEALQEITAVEEAVKQNVETINTLERKVADISETRDKYKAGNSLVKSVLGVDAVNEDTLKEAIKTLKDGKSDDMSMAEIKNLKDLLAKATDEKQSITSQYESKLQNMALDNAIFNAGLGANVANEEMYNIVAGIVRNGAVFDNGEVVYKNADGSTVYGSDNKPLTIKSKIEQIKSDANYAGLFKPDTASGSGTSPRQGDNKSRETISRSNFESKTPIEKSEFIKNGGTIKD